MDRAAEKWSFSASSSRSQIRYLCSLVRDKWVSQGFFRLSSFPSLSLSLLLRPVVMDALAKQTTLEWVKVLVSETSVSSRLAKAGEIFV